MMKKIKVAYCIPSLYIAGGMERVLTIKANYFAEKLNYDVYIITTDGKDIPPYYNLSPKVKQIKLGVNFNELYQKSLFKKVIGTLRKQAIFKKRLKAALNDIRPDITVSMLRREINFINSINDGSRKVGELHVSITNYRKLSELKSIPFLNDWLSKLWTNQLYRKLKKLDHFVVLTHEEREFFPNIKHISVIHNPLILEKIERRATLTNKVVIAVGRYAHQKGYDLLIEAWRMVSEKYPDWTLKIYGVGEKDIYQNLVKQYDLKNVELNDATKNIIEKYKESSIFVLSSRFEGFGLVITEAMQCGVPAISFDCPTGPKDIIEHNVNGLLVRNGDTDALAKNIIYLIENENIRRSLSDNALKSLDKFSIESIANQYDKLFKTLLK